MESCGEKREYTQENGHSEVCITKQKEIQRNTLMFNFVGMFILFLLCWNFTRFVDRLAKNAKKDRDNHKAIMKKYYNAGKETS